MADKSDKDVLSQDELDALLESVQADGTEQKPEAAANEVAAAAETAVDTETDAAPSAENASSEEAPISSPLKMESFTDRPGRVFSALNSFERIEDVPLDLTVELGRTKLLIKDVLDLGIGSIVELEKMAGEPVDLLANGLLIARGEVVVIDDNFGVRITEVITSAERKVLAEEALDLNAA